MVDLPDSLRGHTVTDRIKCSKSKSEGVVAVLNEIDGVSAEELTTDEFDIPPTSIIGITVDLTEI